MKQDPVTQVIRQLSAERDKLAARLDKINGALGVLEAYAPEPAGAPAETTPAPAPRKPARATPAAPRPLRPPKVEKPASGQRAKSQAVAAGHCDVCSKSATASVTCSKGCGKVARGCAEHAGKALGGRIAGHARGCDGKAATKAKKPAADAEDGPVRPADEVSAKRAERAQAIAEKLQRDRGQVAKHAASSRPPVVKDPNHDPRMFRCLARIAVEATGTRAQGTTTCGALVFGHKRGAHARDVHGLPGVEFELQSEEAAS